MRIFLTKNSEDNYKQLLEWNNIPDPIKKRILAPDVNSFFFNLKNDNDTLFISYNKILNVVTRKNSFVKTENVGFIKYDKIKNKFFIKDHYRVLEVILNSEFITSILKELQLEFINTKNIYLLKMSKVLLKKIFMRKITNEDQAISFILRNNYKINPSIVNRKCLRKLLVLHYRESYKTVFNFIERSTNINKTIHWLYSQSKDNKACSIFDPFNENEYSLYLDALKECVLLDEKLDWSRSKEYIKEKHSEFSMRITRIRSQLIKEVKIDYSTELENIHSFYLLNKNTDFLEESSTLNHCLYSNDYFYKAKNFKVNGKYYFSFRPYQSDATIGTLEIVAKKLKTKFGIKVLQFRGYKNKNMEVNHSNELKCFIKSKELQNWLYSVSED